MALPREKQRTPTAIGNIVLVLRDNATGTDEAQYVIDINDQDGELIRQINGNLVPHLNATQLNNVVAFLGQIRAQAIAEIL